MLCRGLFGTLLLLVVVFSASVAAQCSGGYNCNCEQCSQDGYGWFCRSNSQCYSYHWDCGLECDTPCENVVACQAGCYQGYNCTCSQCQSQGYSYFCSGANECYDSYATCSVSCQYTADCQPTTVCAPRMTCQGNGKCNATQTCCVDSNGEQFCAPYAGAVCCEYNQMACPSNHTCDPPSGQCMPPPANPSANCKECQQVVSFIESHGCGACASAFPALAWLCNLVNEMGLCNYIVSRELPPLNMCEIIGFCGEGGCTCGYCRPSLYGQACLSLPNVCPSSSAIMNRSNLSGAVIRASRHLRGDSNKARASDFCVDGTCDDNHNGCCLTCA
jgi:hypothetical protein